MAEKQPKDLGPVELIHFTEEPQRVNHPGQLFKPTFLTNSPTKQLPRKSQPLYSLKSVCQNLFVSNQKNRKPKPASCASETASSLEKTAHSTASPLFVKALFPLGQIFFYPPGIPALFQLESAILDQRFFHHQS